MIQKNNKFLSFFKNFISKLKFSKLFYNDKLLLIVSILISIVLWLSFTMNDSSSLSTRRIDNIPINVELPDSALSDNLTVFFPDKNVASVEISGTSMNISQVTTSDISVTALQTGPINKTGTYELDLAAKNTRPFVSNSFEIIQQSLSPSVVEVLVDKKGQSEFKVKDEISYKVNSDLFANYAQFSPSTISISGPQSILSQIVTVCAKYNISESLTKPFSLDVPLVFYDKDNNIIPNEQLSLLTISQKEVKCDISVLKKKTVDLKFDVLNSPASFDLASKVSVSPQNIEIALPEEDFNNVNSINLPQLDFSKIDPENTSFDLPIDIPSGYKNLSNLSTATISVDLSGYSKKSLDLQNFQFVNVPDSKTATAQPSSITIDVVGLQQDIDKITANDITAVVDLSKGNSSSEFSELPVTFTVNQAYPSCWVYGNYTIGVMLS
ncbi:MAG: CdaR family protein [Clostridia bacterium]|nr:CdaR family protein [Clostridia bacterium]